jgi:hypothetical protein
MRTAYSSRPSVRLSAVATSRICLSCVSRRKGDAPVLLLGDFPQVEILVCVRDHEAGHELHPRKLRRPKNGVNRVGTQSPIDLWM